ncbi:MAG: RagB/SusD family nutrient uptake outer membrane protein [Cyclobacteriaceae bacterium]
MRKVIFTISSLLIMGLTSCEDFLDKAPQDQISKEEALNDIFSLELALNGAYNLMGQSAYYGEFFPLYPDLAGGNLKLASDITSADEENYRPVYAFTMQPNLSSRPNQAYPEMYEVLNAVNNVINAIPGVTDGTEARLNTVLGQALALRALIYFDLLRLYAQPYNFTDDASHPGVVLLERSPSVEDELARATADEVYQLIVADLEKAISILPAFTNAYRISAEAAKALLARVYLYVGEWSRAVTLAGEVINSEEVSLASTTEYPQIWQNGYRGDEYLFRLDMSAQMLTLISDVVGTGVPRPALSVSRDLRALYTETDVRGPGTMILEDENGDWLSAKYPFEVNKASDIPVLRLSEIYLIRAEALARLGRPELAQADLDIIRRRADPNFAPVELRGEALLEAILQERRKELALEGHLLFDLGRTGRDVVRTDCPNNENCSLRYPDPRFVLPIPQNALDANRRLEQNPGY